MTITCQRCDSESAQGSYKDKPAEVCPDCDRILARGV